MSSHESNTELKRDQLALSIWEDDGGAMSQQVVDSDYGRRIEKDFSWTVYHVFSGVPACMDGVVLTGLSRSSATREMLLLNRGTVLRKQRHQLQVSL